MEGEVLNGVLVGGDVVVVEIEDMDDAEVDGADLVGVVIDEADDALGVGAGEAEFLGDLAVDGVEIEGAAEAVEGLVNGVDVAADADAAFGVEAFFTGGAAAGVAEVAAVVVEEGVGDDLFVGGVELGGGAFHEEVGAGGEEGGEVVIGAGVKALEGAEFIEEGTGDDEDVFGHEGEEIGGEGGEEKGKLLGGCAGGGAGFDGEWRESINCTGRRTG